jgi:hypothetical protein
MVATQVATNVVGTRLHPQTAGTLGVPAVFFFKAAPGGGWRAGGDSAGVLP